MITRYTFWEHALRGPVVIISSVALRKGWEGKRVSHDHITFLFQRFDELFKNDRVVHFLSIVIFRSFDGECTSVLDQE